MPRYVVYAVLLVCLLAGTAPAQFKIERIGDQQFFHRPRELSFYSNSHFNRVEAMYLNLGARYAPRWASGLTLFGDAGYGFKNQKNLRWRWQTGLQKTFYVPTELTVGASYFNKVDTRDHWLIGDFENSLAGVFLHEDFMDYFGRRGVQAFADYRLLQTHTLRLDVSRHHYETLRRNSNWSLFGGDKVHPENPRTAFAALPGDEVSVRLSTVWDWRDNPVFTIYGWYADAQLEWTGGDFETTGLFLTLKRYQPTYGDQKFQFKMLLGSRSGSFAQQHLLPLGGLGNLRGYREKEFTGDRLVYLTTNYIIGQQWLRHLPLEIIPIWEAVSLGVFAETGWAWIADPADPKAGLFDPGDFSIKDLRSDVGFSIYFAENLLRIDFARRTDRGDDNWRVLFRILDKF